MTHVPRRCPPSSLLCSVVKYTLLVGDVDAAHAVVKIMKELELGRFHGDPAGEETLQRVGAVANRYARLIFRILVVLEEIKADWLLKHLVEEAHRLAMLGEGGHTLQTRQKAAATPGTTITLQHTLSPSLPLCPPPRRAEPALRC